MKSSVLVILTVGLLAAVSLQERLTTPNDVRKSLAQIEATETGANVLNILQVQTALGGNLDEIKTLLQQMKSQIIKQQQNEDATYAVVENGCKSLINGLNTQIPLYEKTIEEATKRQSNAEADVKETQRNLKDSVGQLSAVNERWERAQANRQEEEAYSNDKYARIKAAIEAVEYAIKLLRFRRSTSIEDFAQLDQHLEKIFSVGKDLSIENFIAISTEVKTLRTSFSGVSFVQYDNKKREMIKLLNKLADIFRALLLAEEKIQKGAAESWAKLSADIQAELKSLKDSITRYNTRIENLNKEITSANAVIADNVKLLESSKKNLESVTADCNAKEKAYQASQTARNGDLELLDKLIAYFDQHTKAITGYLRERIGV